MQPSFLWKIFALHFEIGNKNPGGHTERGIVAVDIFGLEL
jgi:hypothetical protein